ncbi:MAG: hypothetical protein ACOCV3_05800 [Halanaerobiales bacterium]
MQKNYEVFLIVPDKNVVNTNKINNRFNLEMNNNLTVIDFKLCNILSSLIRIINRFSENSIIKYLESIFEIINQAFFISKINSYFEKTKFELVFIINNEPRIGFYSARLYQTEEEFREIEGGELDLLDIDIPVIKYCLWPYVFYYNKNSFIKRFTTRVCEFIAGVKNRR